MTNVVAKDVKSEKVNPTKSISPANEVNPTKDVIPEKDVNPAKEISFRKIPTMEGLPSERLDIIISANRNKDKKNEN